MRLPSALERLNLEWRLVVPGLWIPQAIPAPRRPRVWSCRHGRTCCSPLHEELTPNGVANQANESVGGARELTGRWETTCRICSSGVSTIRQTRAEISGRMAGAWPTQGGNSAAWQKAQVASSWTGAGSDSRRELIETGSVEGAAAPGAANDSTRSGPAAKDRAKASRPTSRRRRIR